MSSGCGDVLSMADLQTAKKHQIFEAEVITGKAGGVATGADIDYATNAVTGQTQKTLPAVLRDAGFSPVSWDFSTGGTLTVNDRDKVVYDPVSKTWYSYAGTLPVTVPAGFSPVGNADWKPQTDPNLRDELAAEGGAALVGYQSAHSGSIATTVSAKLSSILTPFDFGAVGDGVADDTDAIYAYCRAIQQAGQRIYDFAGGKYKIAPNSDKYAITTTDTTGPRTFVIDAAGMDGVTVKNGQFIVDLDMSLGEFTFIHAFDSSNLDVINISGYLTAKNRYELDTVLQPVNTWVRSRANTKNIYNVLVADCTFNMTHVTGSGQQGYSTAYGKLLPVYFDAQVYSSRGTLFFGYRTTLRNCLFDSCIEYASMIWGHHDVEIENCEFRSYGGLSSLPPIRYFSFGANGLKISKCKIYASPSKPSSYTLIQVIYGTDGLANTDNGRLPCKSINISECYFGVNQDQSAIRIGNVEDITISDCAFRSVGALTAADNSSGLATIWVQNDLYTSNAAMNTINKIVIRGCYSNRNRRFLSIANIAGATVKNVFLSSVLAEQCYSFAIIAAERCYASGNIATGTGSVGVGLSCIIPSGATMPWHGYHDNNMSGFADALTVSSTDKDYLLVKNLRAVGNSNSLTTDAEYTTLRTTTSSAISGVAPRYVGELIRTTDTNRVYIAYSDTGWQVLS